MAIGIGLMGFGAIARKHLATVRASGAAEIVGVLDPSPQALASAKAEGLRGFPDTTAFFAAPGLDAVIVATPNQLHEAGALACIERGLPVLIEKPVADSVAAGQRIVAAQKRFGTPVLVGHHRRHNPIKATAREIVRSGRIGKVTAVVGLTLFLKPDDYFDVAWRRESGGGPVLINLIHDIDDLRFICGDIVAIEAMTSSARRGFPVEDTAAVVARLENGAIATLVVSDAVPSPWNWEMASRENPIYPQHGENCCLIAGTEGSLTVPRLELWHYSGRRSWFEPLSCATIAVEPDEPFRRQFAHFIDVIRGRAAPLVTPEDALRTLEATLAVGQAALRTRSRGELP